MSSRRGVVVSGIGFVSCLGRERERVVEGLRAGRSAVRPFPPFIERGFRSQVAAPPVAVKRRELPRSIRRHLTDEGAYALLAALDAVRTAGLEPEQLAGQPVATIIGQIMGPASVVHAYATEVEDEGGPHYLGPYVNEQMMASGATACVAVALGLTGASYGISSACATGLHNVAHAYDLVARGVCEQALGGGTMECTWEQFMGLDALNVLADGSYDDPSTTCRPFCATRSGCVAGGGAAILLLESAEHAAARGHQPMVEVLGQAANSNGHHMTLTHPEQQASLIRAALADAGLDPFDVTYVNPHATGTDQGDADEMETLRRVFGPERPFISSIKGGMGHPIAATGAMEAACTVLMMEEGFVAPNLNLQEVGDDCRHEGLVLGAAVPMEVPVALCLNYGFGGTNQALVLGRRDR